MNAAPPAATLTPPARVLSIDAYRGFVMFLMVAEVPSRSHDSRALADSRFWAVLAHHQSHAEWVGCLLHDLIQPGFSFLVGVALPFSLAAGQRAEDSPPYWPSRFHAKWRPCYGRVSYGSPGR